MAVLTSPNPNDGENLVKLVQDGLLQLVDPAKTKTATGAEWNTPNLLAKMLRDILAKVAAPADVVLSVEQLDMLRDDLISHADTVLAAKIGEALILALESPAGQAAIALAVNTAEDS